MCTYLRWTKKMVGAGENESNEGGVTLREGCIWRKGVHFLVQSSFSSKDLSITQFKKSINRFESSHH